MAKDHVKKFVSRITQDEVFRDKFQSFQSPEDATEFVKNSGYEFTQEEFREYQESEELSDEDLDRVAGGASYCVWLRGDCGWKQCLINSAAW